MISRVKRFRRRRILGPGWVFLATIVLGLLAAWNTGNNLLYIVVGGLSSFLLMSFLLAGWSLRRVRIAREGPSAIHRGESAPIALRIENRKWIMPAVSVRVESVARPGVSAAYLPKIPPQRAGVVRMTEVFERRGVYPLPGIELISGFPFGLFERRVRMRDSVEVVVYPRVVSIRTALFEQLPGARDVPKVAWGEGSEFFSLREYLPGDDIRRIVWRVSARVGKLIVRELVSETCRNVVIVLDTVPREEMPDFADRFEEAIELVASLAVTLLNEQYTVSIVTPDSRVAPGQGVTHIHSVLEMLARLGTADDSTPGGFAWFSIWDRTELATHLFVSPDPQEWGRRAPFGHGRTLDPAEVVRA